MDRAKQEHHLIMAVVPSVAAPPERVDERCFAGLIYLAEPEERHFHEDHYRSLSRGRISFCPTSRGAKGTI
jgi:hypothetical protein